MISLFGIKLSIEAVSFFAAFILSEAIGMSKLRENSVAQMVKSLIDTFRPARSEDEKVVAVRKAGEAVVEAVKSIDN